MSSFIGVLFPSRQNPVQRRGFFSSLAIASLVLLLHFPFEGYDIDHYVTTSYGTGHCKSSSYEDLQICMDRGEIQIKPFNEWKSRAPVIDWFGSLVHAIAALVFALSLGGIWLWVFRTHKEAE